MKIAEMLGIENLLVTKHITILWSIGGGVIIHISSFFKSKIIQRAMKLEN